MKLGIVGLPNVGKSTLFNSLTKAGAESANYPFCTIDPNVGIVTVPDERLNLLADLYHSAKVTPAVIEFDPRLDRAGYRKGNLKGTGRNGAEVKCRHKSMLFICSAGQYPSCREYRRESEYRQRRSIQGRNEDGS